MEKSNKTILAAALAVAIIALAGVGYAATTYKATTTNDGNDLESAYIKMTQGGSGTYGTDFFTKIYFDTQNKTDVNTISYTPVYDSIIDTGAKSIDLAPTSGANCAKVSQALTLTISKTNTKETSATFVVTADKCADITGLTYNMVLVKENETTGKYTYLAPGSVTNGVRTWNFGSIDLNTDASGTGTFDVTYTVYLFITLTNAENPVSSTANIDTAGFNVGGKSTFDFTATVEVTSGS